MPNLSDTLPRLAFAQQYGESSKLTHAKLSDFLSSYHIGQSNT